ncbi:hypothetical protein OUZ56_012299 [Daphnia magna]|uniref:Uncharacterized protein n=1 Tax=Daphnia magna TaxID=35525 RepID=A0ABQ9Z2L1_9CRUS|nr:hypothetical protein OUZ56_012299 [Daphnia magna]
MGEIFKGEKYDLRIGYDLILEQQQRKESLHFRLRKCLPQKIKLRPVANLSGKCHAVCIE